MPCCPYVHVSEKQSFVPWYHRSAVVPSACLSADREAVYMQYPALTGYLQGSFRAVSAGDDFA